MSNKAFFTYKSLLSPEQRFNLTGNACRLYSDIWNQMHKVGRQLITVLNQVVSTRAKIPLEALSKAQDELVSAGLLSIRRNPLGVHSTYAFSENSA